jgi:hypothetical protein
MAVIACNSALKIFASLMAEMRARSASGDSL